MSRVALKQINNSDSIPDSYIAFDGQVNVWRKIHHTAKFSILDLEGGTTLLVSHTLGRKYVNVTVYDEDDMAFLPDSIHVIDEDSLVIGLESFVLALSAAPEDWTITIS